MKLKELRKANKLNQIDIANYLNIANSTYSGYELGTSEPTIETLCKLADYYHVSLDYLVGRNFAHDIGYLTDSERTLLNAFRKMTKENQLRYLSQGQGILIAQ